MTRKSTITMLVLVVLACLPSWAKSQFATSYTASNGPGNILVKSTITGIDTSKYVKISRAISVSTSSTMKPVIQFDTLSILNPKSVSITDTTRMYITITNPKYYNVQVLVIATDTAGKIDTAISLFSIPVFVTPPFKAVTQSGGKPYSSYDSAFFTVDMTAGYDSSAKYKVIACFGSSTFDWSTGATSKTSWKSPVATGTVSVKAGANQIDTKNIGFLAGSSGDPYSYIIIVWNSGSADTSIAFSDTLRSQPGSASISDPYNTDHNSDSVWFKTQTTTTGLATKGKLFIAKSKTDSAFDSTTFTVSAGVNYPMITNSGFGKLNELTDYYVWGEVMDSLNVGWFKSGRIKITTDKKPETLEIIIDSSLITGASVITSYTHVIVPPNDTASIYVKGKKDPNKNASTTTLATYVFGPGVHPLTVSYTGFSYGETAYITMYGSETRKTRALLNEWEVADTVVFNAKAPSLSIVNNVEYADSFNFDVEVDPQGLNTNVSYSVSGPNVSDASSVKVSGKSGKTTIHFHYNADPQSYYTISVYATNLVSTTSTFKAIKTLDSNVVITKTVLPLVVVVDSFGDQNATMTRCYYKYVVPSGKKVDLWADASIDPDTGITGPNFSKKILSGATSTAHAYFDIPNQFKGDLIYLTIWGQTIDTSHQLARKQLIATHLFLGVTMSNGINNDFYLSSFTVYPNPAKDYINIHVPKIGAEMKMYNIAGQLVRTQKLTSTETQLSVLGLEQGLYLINIEGNIQKIIVE